MDIASEIEMRCNIERRGRSQFKMRCPNCSDQRKPGNRRETTLSVNHSPDRLVYLCHHCGIQGLHSLKPQETRGRGGISPPTAKARNPIHAPPNPMTPPMEWPAIEIPTGITEAALEYLQARGIPPAAASKCGLVSGSRFFRRLVAESEGIGFPYRHAGAAYAVKWRAFPVKAFTQQGAASTLFLAQLLTPGSDIILCEGEMDAVSFQSVDLPGVSIPSGGFEAGLSDDSAKLRWLQHHDALLKAAPRIYLAADDDAIGASTAAELARRLGRSRCWRVAMPAGCKDANEVLVKHGPEALSALIQDATPWPIEGIKTVQDLTASVMTLYANGLPPGLSTGWATVDEIFTVAIGRLNVLTGVPGHGKSSWLDNLMVNCMVRHRFRVAYASFENPTEVHLSKLLTIFHKLPFGRGRSERMTPQEVGDGLAWMNERVQFLTLGEEAPTIESLLERFDDCIRRHGTNAIVIDPFNFIRLPSVGGEGQGDTEAINQMLATLKIFAASRGVAVFIVAHPAKPMGQGPDWVPTGYSISGSAHWYNRADFGLTVVRRDKHSELHVWKCRFAHEGKQGSVKLTFNPVTYCYEEHRDAVGSSWHDVDASDPF